MAAVLLRNPHARRRLPVAASLLPTQSSLKSTMLSCIQREEAKSISKKICDTVSELASGILPENGWPELLPFVFQCVSSDSSKLQESAIYTASLQCLSSNSVSSDVKIASLNAVISFVQCLSNSTERDRFQDVLPAMIRTLTESLNNGNEATAQEALELFIELAGTEPRFLRRQLIDVVGSMLQIAEAESLEESTRHLAIEFLVTLAEARERAPGMVRKLPQFIDRLFAVLMKMLEDIEDDPAWYSAETEDEDAGETNNYSMGQECLDRLAIALGGNTIVPVAYQQFSAYLVASEWQKHHASVIALAQIAEGCSKVMIKNLEQVVSMILSQFQSPHPRVRWSAISDWSVCSRAAMDDIQNPRVQAHAASAVLNFSENCTPEILTPYLDGIVSKLRATASKSINGKQMVQEGALTALASVADSSQEHFQKYYDVVMPYLKTILMNATDKSKRMLRAKSMECISLVGMAVGKDKFRDDARQVMEVLMSLQGSEMEADDPITSYMLQAWARLCKCLGQDFIPYMDVVMPPLLQSAQLKPDVTITSADSEDEAEDSDDESMETIILGDKRIGIKTSVLEEKATACNMLCCYVAPTLVPLLKFYFHEEVRRAAVSAMPELMRSAKLAIEQGKSQGHDLSYLKQLSDYIIPAMLEALHKEPDTEICVSMLEAINECLQISGNLLDRRKIRSIVDEVKQERANAEDFDAEEGELIKEENEQEEEIFDQVGEILGTLVKTFKSSFLPFFDELSSYLTPMWVSGWIKQPKKDAICIFDDVAEQCRDAPLSKDVHSLNLCTLYYDTYLPFVLEACNDESPEVRQAAVYGLGVCAEFGDLFSSLLLEALSRLNVVIQQPNARQSENAMAYDNAVSAVGKICQFHRDSIDASQVLPAWLNCLPLSNDVIEAKVVHEQLCSMVERQDVDLLGPNNQYLPKILTVFAEVLTKKDVVTEETAGRMINIIRQLQQTLPPSALASVWSTLNPEQQHALQSMLST
ncbi:hypothetical protein Bca52824_036576 [Brassica carinata]|uniref:TOG domain-containing protein n=1 Tax=Brassica carinata TaxID=52824 RepID=A0A8X7V2R9_BRACI|nr:hypothetical protein Bca52824_036576 [Brassica carinata]